MKVVKNFLPLSIFLIFFILEVYADSIVLSESLKSTESGQGGSTKMYALGGEKYSLEVYACDISTEKCELFVDGKTIGFLSASDIYNFDDEFYLKVNEIKTHICDPNLRVCDKRYEAYDLLEFSIFSKSGFCGDNNCDSGESCSSCQDDCGECQVVCGDGICDSNEDCEKDNCCDGENVDFDKDEDNCGECYNRCKKYEECLNGKCKAYCGNSICDGDESYENCSRDCQKLLTQTNQESDGEEQVKEPIINKKCSEGCYSNGECYGKGNVGIREIEEVYCDGEEWVLRKGLGEACEAKYECKTNFCKNGFCKEKVVTPNKVVQHGGVVERKSLLSIFLSWVTDLFG